MSLKIRNPFVWVRPEKMVSCPLTHCPGHITGVVESKFKSHIEEHMRLAAFAKTNSDLKNLAIQEATDEQEHKTKSAPGKQRMDMRGRVNRKLTPIGGDKNRRVYKEVVDKILLTPINDRPKNRIEAIALARTIYPLWSDHRAIEVINSATEWINSPSSQKQPSSEKVQLKSQILYYRIFNKISVDSKRESHLPIYQEIVDICREFPELANRQIIKKLIYLYPDIAEANKGTLSQYIMASRRFIADKERETSDSERQRVIHEAKLKAAAPKGPVENPPGQNEDLRRRLLEEKKIYEGIR